MTLVDAMQKVSNREYRLRLIWLQREWDKPSRSDWYLMKVIQMLDGIWQRLQRLNPLKTYQIQFGAKKEDPRKDAELRQQQSKAVWANALGNKSVRRS